VVSWGYPRGILGESWGNPGGILGVSWGNPGGILGDSWGVSWGDPGGILGETWGYPEGFQCQRDGYGKRGGASESNGVDAEEGLHCEHCDK
jgi:hypothetical protein